MPHYLTIASANLFNFVAPPNAFYDFENIYDQAQWQAKCEWTKRQIERLNADIIGVQEVFSITAAETLFAELGYPYFVTVDTPHVEDDYIYSKPAVALASRYPITHHQAVAPLTSSPELPAPNFSRQPIHAVIDVPVIGHVAVYVCHLKSQRGTELAEGSITHPLLASWLSSQQRGWEALMLRLFMEQQYSQSPLPTVLMGDFNQSLTSDTTSLFIKPVESEPPTLVLKDSWEVYQTRQPTTSRPATHYHFAKGNVLDYILVSQELQIESPYSLVDSIDYTTLDHHLINPSFEQDKQASDHAFVSAKFQFSL